MAAAASNEETIRCGDCLEEEGYITNPLTLPCDHIFCEPCLSKQPSGEQLKCFQCKQLHDVSIDSLPSAMHATFCEPCDDGGRKNKTALVFCTKCETKYCAKHAEVHDSLNRKHKKISIVAYRTSSFAQELKHCKKHKSEPVTIGCNKCWTVLCPLCISSEAGNCINGANHDLMALIELADEFTAYLEPIKQRAEERIAEISATLKETTLTLGKWDSETDVIVDDIQKARERQLRAIENQYEELEKKYRDSRSEGKQRLTEYREESDNKLNLYLDKLQELRSEIAKTHVIDLVRKKEKMVEGFGEIVAEEFHGAVIPEQLMVAPTAREYRTIEIEIKGVHDFTITPPSSQTSHLPKRPSPTSIELIKEEPVKLFPVSICHYKGIIYVGHEGGSITRIHDNSNKNENFIKLGSWVQGIIAHQDRLYSLVLEHVLFGNIPKIFVHDLNGQQLYTWTHRETAGLSARALTIINDQLVVADKSQGVFSTYTLTGEPVRDIKCNLVNKNSLMTICNAGGNSILVSDVTAELYKVNLTTGKVEWTSDQVHNPIGVLMLDHENALVTTYASLNQTKIWILNSTSGCIEGEIADSTRRLRYSAVHDMCLNGNTLMIPRYCDRAVLFYRLKYD